MLKRENGIFRFMLLVPQNDGRSAELAGIED
jgi:hypothetical protein